MNIFSLLLALIMVAVAAAAALALAAVAIAVTVAAWYALGIILAVVIWLIVRPRRQRGSVRRGRRAGARS